MWYRYLVVQFQRIKLWRCLRKKEDGTNCLSADSLCCAEVAGGGVEISQRILQNSSKRSKSRDSFKWSQQREYLLAEVDTARRPERFGNMEGWPSRKPSGCTKLSEARNRQAGLGLGGQAGLPNWGELKGWLNRRDIGVKWLIRSLSWSYRGTGWCKWVGAMEAVTVSMDLGIFCRIRKSSKMPEREDNWEVL